MALARFIAGLFSRLRSCSFRSDPAPENPAHALGREGERLAARYLRRNGYKILYRNFRSRKGGEVDLVCRDRKADTLVFVEVKTRSGAAFGGPAAAVTRDKQRLIARGAVAWLRLLRNPDILFRFDIVEIVMTDGIPEYNLIRDAFQIPPPFHY